MGNHSSRRERKVRARQGIRVMACGELALPARARERQGLPSRPAAYLPYDATPAQSIRPSLPVMSFSYSPPGHQSTPPVYLPGSAPSFPPTLPLTPGPIVSVAPQGVTSPQFHPHRACANRPVPAPTGVSPSVYLACRSKVLQEKEKTRQLEIQLELRKIGLQSLMLAGGSQ